VFVAFITLAATTSGLSSCGRANDVTGPSPSPPANVAGTFEGSVHYYDGDWWLFCPTIISVTFRQSGSSVSASLNNRCIPNAHFEGTVQGTQLAGTLTFQRNFKYRGDATGSVSGSQITLTARHLDISPPNEGYTRVEGFLVGIRR